MIFFKCYIFLIGSIIGSFINVCVHRYKSNESFLVPHSHCTNCNHPLRWLDLIPIISWFLLKGKCKYCKHHISFRYPLVEFLTGFLFFLILYEFSFSATTFIYLIAASILIFAAFVDMDIMIIPDRTHLFLAICSVLLLFLQPESYLDRVIGSICLSLPLFIVAFIANSIGYGDIKLLASLGLLLGYQDLLLSFFISSLIGSLVALYLIFIKKYTLKLKIPFGPYLIFSAFISLLYGNSILNWYLSI